MTYKKTTPKFAQPFRLFIVVVTVIALISVVSDYQGFVSFSIGMEGINLTVDGR